LFDLLPSSCLQGQLHICIPSSEALLTKIADLMAAAPDTSTACPVQHDPSCYFGLSH
jgi:hypothetical protein